MYLVCVCETLGVTGNPLIALFLLNWGWQQERESATNEETLAFLMILALIPAYLRFT